VRGGSIARVDRGGGKEGREAYRAEDGLEYGGARGVGDVHGVELLAQGVIGGGVAAAAGAGGVGGAEFERRVERHRRPCREKKKGLISEGTDWRDRADPSEEVRATDWRRCIAGRREMQLGAGG
jgi:hypothetical protein